MELKQALKTAFDAAAKEYENGHLKGDQIKDLITKATALIDADAAQLMQGTKISKGGFKIKLFPTDKLKSLSEPAFQDVSVNAPVAETDNTGLGEDEDEYDKDVKKPFNADDFILMSPKKALDTYGIETIERMISNFKVEIKEGLNDTQKTAALIAALKKMK